MRNSRFGIFIIVAFLMTQLNAQGVTGLYTMSFPNHTSRDLDLRSDATFTYIIGAIVKGKSTSITGTWRQEGQTVILNSEYQPVGPRRTGDCETLQVKVLDQLTFDPVVGAEIRTSGSASAITANTNQYGIANIPSSGVETLTISKSGFHEIKYQVPTTICYQELMLLDTSVASMTNETYIIRKDSLCRDFADTERNFCLVKVQ